MDRYIALYSTKPIRGYFQYKDLFLIRPEITAAATSPYLAFPNVVITQFNTEPSSDSNSQWVKHIWDNKRLGKFERSPHWRTNEFKEWLRFYKLSNERLIPEAIAREICGLLTFYSNCILSIPSTEQSWATTLDGNTKVPIPVQLGYIPVGESVLENDAVLTTFSPITRLLGASGFELYPHAHHVGQEERNNFLVREDFELHLDAYFCLQPNLRLRAYTAISSYIKALTLKSKHPTLALVSLSIAIEALMATTNDDSENSRCQECGSFRDSVKCTVCGGTIYKLRSRFLAFMNEYAGTENSALYKKLYDVRSSSVHGELLRAEFGDTGFYVGENDEQAMFLSNSIALSRFAILNWIIQRKSVTEKI